MPHISVVVPFYNSQETIEACLKSIRLSEYKDYELIVIDDVSKDNSALIANKYADTLIKLKKHQGRNQIRKPAFKVAKGKIVVSIDSDVLIKPNSLSKINEYFLRNPNVSALTGMLSEDHDNRNFFSQYKNLYMCYIFSKLPKKVTFLYGSIFAIKKGIVDLCDSPLDFAEDADIGQKIHFSGREIAFLKDLKVTHLKKYTFLSFLKNDFRIPFYWAKIFVKNKGFRQLGKNKCGFIHSPKSQIISIALVGVILIFTLLTILKITPALAISLLLLIWFLINLKILNYLAKKKGLIFAILSLPVTFLDNMVMGIAIVSGFLRSFAPRLKSS